jgi:adenine phosphoribosyltransferase
MSLEERLSQVRASIRVIPDWPKPGILFQDITTLLLDPVAYRICTDLLVERYRSHKLDVVVAFESRGFFFGPPIALALGLPFVPLRKPKKLPGPTLSEKYALEYGEDALEMHVGAVKPGQRVLLVDDLIATGGTLAAGARLVRAAGGEPVEACAIIELPELHGRSKLSSLVPDMSIFTLLEIDGVEPSHEDGDTRV